ncbi:MAG: hypothetical protein ACI89X_002839 [Planctomycetota bacterium]|jgi:hypothetical protein
MVKATRRIAAVAMVVLGMGLSGCGGTPATPEQRRLAERQFMLPFLQDTEVACSELEIDITPNFHLHIGLPGEKKGLIRFDKVDMKALVEKTWRNLTGGRAGWLTVTISEPKDPTDVSSKPRPRTTYTVTHQFTLRTHERAAMTLSARATGSIVMVREAGGKHRDAREFAIENGVVQK